MDKMLLKENRWMDDVLFPMSLHRISSSPHDNIFTCHWHEELEFLQIQSGNACIQIGTEYVPLRAGEALLINSGELHAGHVIETGNWPGSGSPPPDADRFAEGFRFSALVFHPSLLYGSHCDAVQTRWLDPVVKGRFPAWMRFSPETEWERRILSDLAEMEEGLAEKPLAYEVGLKALLFDVFYRILGNSLQLAEAKAPADSVKAERMKLILTRIRDQYATQLRIEDMAELAGFSPGHFCTFFRQMTGSTFISYLNRYRVNRAADLLRTTDRKILDIAMEVGFDNASYFISRFKQILRCTPQAYRNEDGNPGKAGLGG